MILSRTQLRFAYLPCQAGLSGLSDGLKEEGVSWTGPLLHEFSNAGYVFGMIAQGLPGARGRAVASKVRCLSIALVMRAK